MPSIRVSIFSVACVPVMLALCGCGGSDELEVSGTVTFDGKPVNEGDITFRASDRGYGGKIKDGKYTMTVPPGKSRVEITAFRETGKMLNLNPGEDPIPELEPYIPEKYNSSSVLSADVSSDKKTFDFKLESK
jgi:hypothetical protein